VGPNRNSGPFLLTSETTKKLFKPKQVLKTYIINALLIQNKYLKEKGFFVNGG
jgi:hypothetical protein